VAVAVVVMVSGKVPWARLTSCDPEHMPVGTAVCVPVVMYAMHVLPFWLWHLKPLRILVRTPAHGNVAGKGPKTHSGQHPTAVSPGIRVNSICHSALFPYSPVQAVV
jgi:hypothetical protein